MTDGVTDDGQNSITKAHLVNKGELKMPRDTKTLNEFASSNSVLIKYALGELRGYCIT